MMKHPRAGRALITAAVTAGAAMLLGPRPDALAGRTPSYAITKARIVTVSGAVLENATLVVRDGVLLDVGPSAAIP